MRGTPDWARVKELFHAALDQPADNRTAFIRAACGSDQALLAEVQSLLAAHHEAGDFGERPAFHVLADTATRSEPAATPAVSLAAGDRLGRYEIVHLVGAGGMGAVYKATDTRLRRTVAIKVLHSRLRGHIAGEQFAREAMSVAALRHPHICVLHDIGTHEDIEYLVMEYLSGETLADRIAHGSLHPRDVLRYGCEIADALAETHRHGIVHRDIKPSNIMLTPDGAKLLDFGVARLHSAPHTGAGSLHDDGLSLRSSALGTLGYMAPEQLQGRQVDGRTDLFAFGAVLYEMVTGRKAFHGDTALGVTFQILERDPAPIATDGSGLLESLDAIIRRCVEKKPEDRWQTAGDLADALRALESAGPARATPVSWHKYAAWALAALAIAVMLYAAFARFGPSDDRRRGTDAARLPPAGPLALGKIRLLTLEERLESDPRISPDGTRIVFSAGNLRQRRILVREIAGGGAVPVAGEANAVQYQPRWSPDGREILYVSPEGAFIVAATGGKAKTIAAPPRTEGSTSTDVPSLESGFSIHSAAWSPTGREVAITSGGSLAVTSVAAGSVRTLVENYKVILHSCDWSGDGKWIACVAGNWAGSIFDNRSPSVLVVVPAGGGPVVEVTEGRALHLSPVWSSTSDRLYFVSNRDGTNDIYWMDMKDGRAAGAPVRATTGLGAHSIAFSRGDTRLVYASVSLHANIWSLPIPAREPADTSRAQPVTSGNQTIETLRISLDGRWLLYDSNQQGNADVFRVPTAGGAVEQLTTDPADDFAPDLSPDGRYVAFHSWRATSRDVFVQPIDGGPAEQVTSTPRQEMYPVWSPDGRALVFYDATIEAGVFRGPFLVRRQPSGGWGAAEALRSVHAACRPPIPCRLSWSRDGKFLAYASGGAAKIIELGSGISREVYAPSPHSNHPRAELVLVGEDGETLFFKSHDSSGRASLWSVPVSGGPAVLRVRFNDPFRQSMRPDFAVGAGRFFFTIEDRRSNVWIADVAGR